jgi:hypothetical protein
MPSLRSSTGRIRCLDGDAPEAARMSRYFAVVLNGLLDAHVEADLAGLHVDVGRIQSQVRETEAREAGLEDPLEDDRQRPRNALIFGGPTPPRKQRRETCLR